MRDLIVIIVILVLVFGGDILIEKYLESTSKELIQHIEKMSGGFKEKEEVKNREVEELIGIWEEKEKPWIIIEYHDAINQIEDLVIETYSWYLNDDKEEFDIAYRKLMRLIDDLRNRVDLSLENVL